MHFHFVFFFVAVRYFMAFLIRSLRSRALGGSSERAEPDQPKARRLADQAGRLREDVEAALVCAQGRQPVLFQDQEGRDQHGRDHAGQ